MTSCSTNKTQQNTTQSGLEGGDRVVTHVPRIPIDQCSLLRVLRDCMPSDVIRNYTRQHKVRQQGLLPTLRERTLMVVPRTPPRTTLQVGASGGGVAPPIRVLLSCFVSYLLPGIAEIGLFCTATATAPPPPSRECPSGFKCHWSSSASNSARSSTFLASSTGMKCSMIN